MKKLVKKMLVQLFQNWERGQRYRRLFIYLGMKVGIFTLITLIDNIRFIMGIP